MYGLKRWLLIFSMAFGHDLTIDEVCRYDLHDYPRNRGGDGHPSHFYTYTCWNCGKEFGI